MRPQTFIDTDELRRSMSGPAPPLVVSVASAAEHRSVRIPGSRRLDDLARFVREVPRDRPIVVSCRSRGSLTASWARRMLVEHGYHDVRVHTGGLRAWEAAGLPIVTER